MFASDDGILQSEKEYGVDGRTDVRMDRWMGYNVIITKVLSLGHNSFISALENGQEKTER